MADFRASCSGALAWFVVLTIAFVLLFPLVAPLLLGGLRGLFSFLNSIGS